MSRPAIFALGAGFGSLFVVGCMHLGAYLGGRHVLEFVDQAVLGHSPLNPQEIP